MKSGEAADEAAATAEEKSLTCAAVIVSGSLPTAA
jgi:hypothetical protein